MEEKKKEKENGTAIVMTLLIIVILGLVGYICYDKVLSKKSIDSIEKSNNSSNSINRNDLNVHKTGSLYKNDISEDAICTTNSETPYVKGTEYVCDNLGDGKTYTFYVLSNDNNGEKINLIMDSDYAKASYINSGDFTDSNNASLGPINAIKSLPTLNIWSNLESPKDSSGYNYSQYAARLPMAVEIANACDITNFTATDDKAFELKNNSSCSFLWKNTQYVDSSYNYSGYYTSTSLETYYNAWSLYSTNMTKEEYEAHIGAASSIQLYDTVLLNPTSANSELGIRPVISLSK